MPARWHVPNYTPGQLREFKRREEYQRRLRAGEFDYVESRGDDEVAFGYRSVDEEDEYDTWGGMDAGIGWFGDN